MLVHFNSPHSLKQNEHNYFISQNSPDFKLSYMKIIISKYRLDRFSAINRMYLLIVGVMGEVYAKLLTPMATSLL